MIDNLNRNIANCDFLPKPTNISATGYLWGSSITPLLSNLPNPDQRFDTLILADLLFNHHCHEALLSTVLATLKWSSEACALVFFTPYRPWLLERDMQFFELCKEKGLRVEKIQERLMEKVMFEEDRGDERLRRTVLGFEVRWGNLGETEGNGQE